MAIKGHASLPRKIRPPEPPEPEELPEGVGYPEPKEKPRETQTRPRAYYISLENHSYDELCWLLAEKILKYTIQSVSREDIRKKAEQIFRSFYTYEVLCWLNAEMELLLSPPFI